MGELLGKSDYTIGNLKIVEICLIYLYLNFIKVMLKLFDKVPKYFGR